MTEIAHALGRESNRRRYKCDVDFFWRDLLVAIFPNNTAACTASFTHTSVGAAAHVLRGRNGLSGRALVNLLRSPIGDKVLDAILGDAAGWRALELRLIEIAKLQNENRQERSALARTLRR